jgi:hypothetical protein
MNTNELIDNIKNGDNVKANDSFNTVMREKLKDSIDAKKIDIASSLGKKAEPEEE